MPETTFPDEWLLQSLEGLVTPEQVAGLRTRAPAGRSLWETLVSEKVLTDEKILEKLSARYRMKIATLAQVDPAIRDGVPEQLARRFHMVPVRMTDSFLEIATSNPFDLDAEKAIAFAMTREIRLLLAAPSQIAAKLDELYRPEKALDRLLEGMAEPGLVTLGTEAPPEDINLTATEAEASQRPVVKLVDLIISEGIRSEEHTSELQSRLH